ncbi:MAG: beta-ketoacyl-ACP synthase II [Anaerolineae bacterium]
MTSPFVSLGSTIAPDPILDRWEQDDYRPEPLNEFAPLTRHRRPRVVITGIGVIAPNGNTPEEFWANCLAGKSGTGPITRFDASGLPCRVAGEVKNFDPRDYIDFKEARRMARCSQFAIACARMAAADARLILPVANPERVGIYMGTAVGGYDQIEIGIRTEVTKGWQRISPFAIGAAMPNAAAFLVGMTVGAKGYLSTVTAACASGTQSIGEAAEIIRRGWADVMFAGGTEAGVIETGIAGFCQMRALTLQNDEPQKASRPFDKNRDGMVMGEGAAVVVLESLDHAISRDAPILAEVLGSSVVADAYDVAAPDPTGLGEERVMRLALIDAGIGMDEIDYINAHATSTPIGDPIETRAIKRLFGERAYKIPISATKSMLGHTLGASGAIEAVVSVLTLRDQKIHPTINYETPDPQCDLDYVPNVARAATVETILSNSFGLGGQNACLILRKFDI